MIVQDWHLSGVFFNAKKITGWLFLVGVVEQTHLKNMRPSNWVKIFNNFRGVNFHLGCHHLVLNEISKCSHTQKHLGINLFRVFLVGCFAIIPAEKSHTVLFERSASKTGLHLV